jgi:hypothetical protein
MELLSGLRNVPERGIPSIMAAGTSKLVSPADFVY